jgi:hypothetical protein
VPRIAPVTTKIAPVAAQVATVLPEFNPVTTDFPPIGPDFTTVRTQLLLRSSFASILQILPHVGSCFTPVLPGFNCVAPELSPVSADLSAISAEFAAFRRCKPAAIRVLRQRDRRETCQRDSDYKQTSY